MMAQRRPSSATSLSNFAHQQDPPAEQAGLDFCNAFWGPSDAGYDVLLARMRGAMRTMEELRAFWKERAAIENEYAGKLAKLARFQLGRDEIGELRNSLDTLKVETEKQAVVHQELAGKMRQELELPVGSFITRQVSHKKTIQATVEKGLKNKQAQEGHVQKARERYESDCLKINSAMAQQTLVQGKELERVRMKLERAQATIGSNEKEYHSFTRALADTTKKWEQQWKDFCDTCQDLEDDRIEFMKDNVWSYANAVSSVCVSDDESCEHIRVSLEQLEVDRDMENFISAYGTGSIIPDPPRFVDFRAGAPGDTQQGRRGRLAQFVRESKKVGGPLYGTTPVEDYELDNGAHSGGSRAATPLDAHPALPPQPLPPPFSQPPPQQGSYQGHPGRSGALEPVMLNVGGTAYPVDPNADPQRYQHPRQPSISNSVGTVSTTAIATPGASDDPLAQAMNQLRQDSVRRGTPTRKDTINSVTSPHSATSAYSSATGGGSAHPNKAQPPHPINYDAISESIVGGPPPGTTPSGQNGAPMAKFMQQPVRPSHDGPVDEALRNYQQSFPGENKHPSRPGSSMSRNSTQHVQQAPPPSNQNLQRPVSPAREGFPGIGAQGRSPSPSFNQNQQRAVSPYGRSISPGQHMPMSDSPAGMSGRDLSPQPPTIGRSVSPGAAMGRPVSPAGVYGIELDASGKVARDSVAEEYERKRREEEDRRRREEEERLRRQREEEERMRRAKEEEDRRRREEEVRQQQMAEQARLAEQARQQQQQQQQQQSMYNQPPARPGYGNYPPGPPGGQPPYQQGPPPAQTYPMQNDMQRGPPQPTQYQPPAQAPQQAYGAPPQQPGYAQPPPQQYQPAARQPSYDNYYQQQPLQQAPPPPAPSQQTVQQQGGGQVPLQDLGIPASGNGGNPPTGQWTSTGEGILFYVKALYDYQASIDEEFDFQTGDIIAVTATPEDGWWSGELLDEARRQKGKHIFPSNFVCLF
ncbi:hypothetical protein CALVIDRAFT_551097 [Calocera viscosa TUFC12733]|uniref:SH3 domain-containing protein n=1 Tax=Calocera viscosa (strain TUFC12733) TaxID=1330018 RepID=A0A167I419_CALVF|nr:hypothetical protein CALVIDRAFT_551097 [Calocera viscosa TUFC12733]